MVTSAACGPETALQDVAEIGDEKSSFRLKNAPALAIPAVPECYLARALYIPLGLLAPTPTLGELPPWAYENAHRFAIPPINILSKALMHCVSHNRLIRRQLQLQALSSVGLLSAIRGPEISPGPVFDSETNRYLQYGEL